MKSGASISEMNRVRRHLSAIKGGRLAAACHPAKVVTLLISDVPGDRPMDIASGPTVPDPTTCADALAIIKRYAVELPANVMEILQSGRGESVKPGDPRLAGSETRFVATPQMALEAAAAVARDAGVPAYILGDGIEGEARRVVLIASHVRGEKILGAVGAPAHWTAELARGMADDRVLGREAGLHAEAATDVAHAHAEFVGLRLEHRAKQLARAGGRLVLRVKRGAAVLAHG